MPYNWTEFEIRIVTRSFNCLLRITFRFIGLVGRVFANGLGDQGSIQGRVIPKTLKNGTWDLLA